MQSTKLPSIWKHEKNFILTVEGAKHTKTSKKTKVHPAGEGRTKSQIFANQVDESKKSTATGMSVVRTFHETL